MTQGHHLILGTLTDCLTGEILDDTHDERLRQKIAKFLIEKKGYSPSDITPRFKLLVQAGIKKAILPIDFYITLSGMIRMIIKYGPGSLVTRHRPSLAASRLIAPYQIPVVVVTNGIDADVLDGFTGNVISSGLNSIPERYELLQTTSLKEQIVISKNRADIESRILYAYEVDGSCPCDDTICRISGEID